MDHASPSLSEDLKQLTAPPQRTAKGTFPKGVSGNPAGRAKGSRNKITLQRLELEEALRGDLGKVGRKILKKAIDMALNGDPAMIKLLLDKTLSTLRNEDVGEQRDTEIKVEINNLTAAVTPPPPEHSALSSMRVIDVTPVLPKPQPQE